MDYINVTNRSGSMVFYSLPEMHVNRVFAAKETKKIPVEELTSLGMIPGGAQLIHNYLYVDNEAARVAATNINEEVEYFLKEADIPEWMQTCSLDAFKDALDFAPEGVKELIKRFSVELPLNDVAKREAMKAQLGFNVDEAVKNDRESKAEAENAAAAGVNTGRRVVADATAATPTQPVRRVIKTAN